MLADVMPQQVFIHQQRCVVQTTGGRSMPRGKKFTAERIIGKLREAEGVLARGRPCPRWYEGVA